MNVEYLFESAISAIEAGMRYEDWLELEVKKGNITFGFKEIKIIWRLAHYVEKIGDKISVMPVSDNSTIPLDYITTNIEK